MRRATTSTRLLGRPLRESRCDLLTLFGKAVDQAIDFVNARPRCRRSIHEVHLDPRDRRPCRNPMTDPIDEAPLRPRRHDDSIEPIHRQGRAVQERALHRDLEHGQGALQLAGLLGTLGSWRRRSSPVRRR